MLRPDARNPSRICRVANNAKGLNTHFHHGARITDRKTKLMSTILLIILVLLLVGALPTWPHSTRWGYGPSGGLGLVLLIVLILVLMGRI